MKYHTFHAVPRSCQRYGDLGLLSAAGGSLDIDPEGDGIPVNVECRERAHGWDWHAGILVTVTVPRLLSTDLSNKALHYGTVRCAAVGIV